jgi:hypothetical protein
MTWTHLPRDGTTDLCAKCGAAIVFAVDADADGIHGAGWYADVPAAPVDPACPAGGEHEPEP